MKALAMVIPFVFALTAACGHVGTTPSLRGAADGLLSSEPVDVRREMMSAVERNAPAEVVGSLDDAQSVQAGGIASVPQQLSKRGVAVDPGLMDRAVEQVKRLKH